VRREIKLAVETENLEFSVDCFGFPRVVSSKNMYSIRMRYDNLGFIIEMQKFTSSNVGARINRCSEVCLANTVSPSKKPVRFSIYLPSSL
jgi:hypothetical protein